MAPKFSVNIHHDAADLLEVAISFTASGDNIIVTGVAGKLIRVYKIFFLVGTTTAITYKDGASTLLSGALPFSSNEGMVLDFDTKPWFSMANGNSFILNSSNTAQVSGTAYYTRENA